MTRNPNLPLPASQLGSAAVVQTSVVSDDPLLRRALTSLLEQIADVKVVDIGEAEVVLWDPGTDSERALVRMREIKNLSVPALVVITSPDHLGPALAAGARGVVLRADVGPDLGAALAAVKGGLTVVDASLSATLIANAASIKPDQRPGRELRPERRGIGELTERERQVVSLMTEGLSNKLIADRLGISDHTAKFHVNGVMAKLAAGTRTEAVVEAVRRGLVAL